MGDSTHRSSRDTREDTKHAIVDVAEELYRTIGFQKTTVADIARELRMSPANVYRFFASKAEINEAVSRQVLSKIEAAIDKIIHGIGSASDKLRECIGAVEQMNIQRALSDRKLQELLEAAFQENWPIRREHTGAVEKLFSKIVSEGNGNGEFSAPDCDVAALLICSACLNYLHPRLVVENFGDAVPTKDQMVDFCLAAFRRNEARMFRRGQTP